MSIALGLEEPMMIRSPNPDHRKNSVTYSLTSLLDIVPTLLDWFNIPYIDRYSFDTNDAPLPRLTGKSLLPLLVEGRYIYSSPSSALRQPLTSLNNAFVQFQSP